MEGKKLMGKKKVTQKCFNVGQSIYGSRKPKTKQTNTKMEFAQPWERLIEFYFEIGLKYKDIKSVLSSRHGFDI